ncbi:hypothetical protein JCM8208_007112 [Rhodotorula glutinis]
MADPSSSTVVQPQRAKRSQFIDKLHALLENPLDEESFHWTHDGKAFEITTNELKARHALSAQYEFRSLSSFIRQLSYYNFKRLTDRRKSAERKNGNAAFISFMHPSGFFVSGDSSQLDGIIRKSRARRVESGRRDSLASTTSADSASSPFPQYDGGQPGPSYSTAPRHSFSYAPPPPSAYAQQQQVGLPHDSAAWSGYSSSSAVPVASGSSFPAYLGALSSYDAQHEPSQWTQPSYRRASLTQFRVDTSPRTKPAEAPGAQAYQHSSSSLAPHALSSIAPGGDLRSSYTSAGYPVELGGRPPAPAGYHYVDQAPSTAHNHQHAVPSGLPIASHDSHLHRPSWPPSSGSFYTPMPHLHDESSTLAPLQSNHPHSHSHLQPHRPQESEPVAPGTAYSSEEDPPPAPAHAAPHSHPHPFFSTSLPRHDAPTGAQPQQHLASPTVNLFPNLTHFHLPAPAAAPAVTATPPHSHSYEQWRAHAQQQQQQDQERRASVQLPPFAPGGPTASPVQYSHAPPPPPPPQYAPQQHQPQQQYGDSGSSGRTTPVHGAAGPSGKLGWAPPAASTQGAAAAGVFGQWAGFGGRGLAERESPDRGGGGGGGREGDERGGGS